MVRAAAVFPCPGSEWRRIAWPNEVFIVAMAHITGGMPMEWGKMACW